MDMKDNSIVLFPNDKEGNDSRPDFRGEGLYNGVSFEVSVWKNSVSQSPVRLIQWTLLHQVKSLKSEN